MTKSKLTPKQIESIYIQPEWFIEQGFEEQKSDALYTREWVKFLEDRYIGVQEVGYGKIDWPFYNLFTAEKENKGYRNLICCIQPAFIIKDFLKQYDNSPKT